MRAPLEALVEGEDVTPNWELAVELGQALERMLALAGASAGTIGLFRTAYPTPRPSDLSPAARRDHELVRFLRICGGRSIDGVAALTAARASAPAPPAEVGLPAGAEETAARTALAAFLEWERAVYGRVGVADAPAWRPERLDYDVEVAAHTADARRTRLQAHAGPRGEFDWYAFDEIGRDAETAGEAPSAEDSASSVFPTNVSFAGMPQGRWWQFEDARFNWASVDADRREIAKAMILDFMLVQGKDWFIAPLGLEVGVLATINELVVRDVFGEHTLVSRAEAGGEGGANRWTMFSTIAGGGAAEYFILPPSTLRTTIDGPDLEEVRFLRDEQANLVWAVETKAENGVGRAWPGHERALTVPDETPPPPDTDGPAALPAADERSLALDPVPAGSDRRDAARGGARARGDAALHRWRAHARGARRARSAADQSRRPPNLSHPRGGGDAIGRARPARQQALALDRRRDPRVDGAMAPRGIGRRRERPALRHRRADRRRRTAGVIPPAYGNALAFRRTAITFWMSCGCGKARPISPRASACGRRADWTWEMTLVNPDRGEGSIGGEYGGEGGPVRGSWMLDM